MATLLAEQLMSLTHDQGFMKRHKLFAAHSQSFLCNKPQSNTIHIHSHIIEYLYDKHTLPCWGWTQLVGLHAVCQGGSYWNCHLCYGSWKKPAQSNRQSNPYKRSSKVYHCTHYLIICSKSHYVYSINNQPMPTQRSCKSIDPMLPSKARFSTKCQHRVLVQLTWYIWRQSPNTCLL